jgi:hypothetical protein
MDTILIIIIYPQETVYLDKMEIQFALNLSDGLVDLKNMINRIEDEVNFIIKDKQYGNGITQLHIGWICVMPEYDFFFKYRKPKYYKKKRINIDNVSLELNNIVEYEIKIEYEIFKRYKIDEAMELVITAFLNSLTYIDQIGTQIKNFDFLTFKLDLTNYFNSKKESLN